MMNLTSWRKVAGQVFRDRADKLRAGLEISHVGLRLEGKWTVVALVPSRPFCQHDHSATHRPVAMADNDDRVNTEITGHPTSGLLHARHLVPTRTPAHGRTERQEDRGHRRHRLPAAAPRHDEHLTPRTQTTRRRRRLRNAD